MRTIVGHAPAHSSPSEVLCLPFEDRQRSRLRCRLQSGEEVGLILPRGTVLRGGDLLSTDDGKVVRVEAAPELVSIVRASDPSALARAAYHLGNRHIAVEVGDGFLRYLHDHVLDAMVRSLGLLVASEAAPFEPESGAYAGAGHSHGHHEHGHHEHGHHEHGHHEHGHHEHDAGHGHGRR